MIKIETSKNFSAPKNAFNTSASAANAEGIINGDEGETTDTGSEFARVLESLTSKKETTDQQVKTSDKPREREKDVHSENNRRSDNESSNKDNSGNDASRGEEDAARSAAAAHLNAHENSALESELFVAPPARAIMHIADLERLISTVRSQTFDGNSQVTITLKNSVFSGLQVKLTADQNQQVKAEFIAANEKVKAQIDARSGELADLLRQRGIKLTSLQTAVGSETSGGNEKRQNSAGFDASAVSSVNAQNQIRVNEEQISELNETANTYRV